MKKILIIILFFCSLPTIVSGQDWNIIGEKLKHCDNIENKDNFISVQQYMNKTFETRRKDTYVYYSSIANTAIYLDGKLNEPLPEGFVFIKVQSKEETILKNYDLSEVIIPKPIYNRYIFGHQLMKAGWIDFGIGLGVATIGGILLAAKDGQTIPQIKAGDALLGIGGTLLSVSIPLLCFGDDAKREANVDYEIFNLY